MEKMLTPRERIFLIRKGNELFNRGEVEQASKIFMTTAYKDGLIRIGDYYFFEKKNPFKALHYYIEAKYEKRIREITERMARVLKKWLSEDNTSHESVNNEKTEKKL